MSVSAMPPTRQPLLVTERPADIELFVIGAPIDEKDDEAEPDAKQAPSFRLNPGSVFGTVGVVAAAKLKGGALGLLPLAGLGPKGLLAAGSIYALAELKNVFDQVNAREFTVGSPGALEDTKNGVRPDLPTTSDKSVIGGFDRNPLPPPAGGNNALPFPAPGVDSTLVPGATFLPRDSGSSLEKNSFDSSIDPADQQPLADGATILTPEMKEKILYGIHTRKNIISGAHSPNIKELPELFDIISSTPKEDGAELVEFRKLLSDGRWSKKKKSIVAPSDWTDEKIIGAAQTVANTPPIATRARDGATLHRDRFDGVEWEVIKNGNGTVTSSYPTGGDRTNVESFTNQ